MLKHKYYLYHEENRVYARMGKLAPVLFCVYDNSQAAHDAVQAVINPSGMKSVQFSSHKGFGSEVFQSMISENCKDDVLAAYAMTAAASEPKIVEPTTFFGGMIKWLIPR